MPALTEVSIGEIADLVGAVAWPLVAVVVALLFRAPLRALLRRDQVEIKAPGGFSVSAKGQQAAASALVQASASKDGTTLTRDDAETGVEGAALGVEVLGRPPQVLWVDDRPSNNRYEVEVLTSLGMHVSLSTSTEDALHKLEANGPFDVVISDMGRPPDPQAGYTLLSALRGRGDTTPFVIYASSGSAEDFDAAVRRGAVGCTNEPQELIDMVSNALRSGQGRRSTQ